MFLSGRLGGEPLYVKRCGQPRLRARRAPFPIGEEERDQWRLCAREATLTMHLPTDSRETLEQAFLKVADFMPNKAD